MRSFCHRLLQRLAFIELRHFNRDKDPANTMAYDRKRAGVQAHPEDIGRCSARLLGKASRQWTLGKTTCSTNLPSLGRTALEDPDGITRHGLRMSTRRWRGRYRLSSLRQGTERPWWRWGGGWLILLGHGHGGVGRVGDWEFWRW